jgi:transposase-like protein
MFKTPDALLNGQSTVEVVKSCIPAIQDPWKMPSIDVDAVLVAVRIATYGEKMEVSTNCPSCEAVNDYEINLNTWLEKLNQFQFDPKVVVDPLTVYVRPYTYLEMTQTSLKSLEQQRIFSVINDDQLSDEDKLDKFGKSFSKLTQLTVDVIAQCIAQIETPDGIETDATEIKNFIHNSPKEIFNAIADHVQALKTKIDIPAQEVKCTSCSTEFQEAERMEKEVRKIKKEAFQMAWYMRGMSYAEAMNLSWDEREIISEIIKDNLETTKKTNLPFF